ncbi:MAG: hypothetical protein CMA63_05930 [Euryarchaeota archaeon]|nr:hypothetical protein [Euryarchaeota archaeon]
MADSQPSRTVFPSVTYGGNATVQLILLSPEESLSGTVVFIGMKEPKKNTCWIKKDVVEGWKLLMETTHELLKAGYPGCLGCGGPHSELPWDEEKSRQRIQNNE